MQQLHRHLMRFPSAWRVVASGGRVSFAPNVPESVGNARSRDLQATLRLEPKVGALAELSTTSDERDRSRACAIVTAVSRGHPVLPIGTHLPTSSSSNRMAPVWSTLLLRMHSYVTRVAQFRLRFFSSSCRTGHRSRFDVGERFYSSTITGRMTVTVEKDSVFRSRDL